METLQELLEKMIEEEKQFQEIEFHRGRVSAFQFVLGLLQGEENENNIGME